MEVIILSKNKNLRTELNSLTDKFLCKRRIRSMSLSSDSPQALETLNSLLKNGKGYLIVLDIQSYPNWIEIILEVMRYNKAAKFFVLSNSDDAAVEIINQVLNVCGYINRTMNKLKDAYERLLLSLYGKIKTVCGGIMVNTSDGGIKIVPFESIYYIETIKQTHLCNIIHKNGSDYIRADISKLIENLDCRFAITRSSTIANLAAVTFVNSCGLYFTDSIFCSVSAQKNSYLKKQMQCQAIINTN